MNKQQLPPYEPVKIDEKFWAIEQNGVRCYLFEGEDMALLVDAGFGGDLKTVCEKLTDKPIQLLITHADGDHMRHSSAHIICTLRNIHITTSATENSRMQFRCGKGIKLT